MSFFRKIRSFRRKLMRSRLVDYAIAGARTAHLPAFLDRGPRHDLHRAYRAAFMRGFKYGQAAML